MRPESVPSRRSSAPLHPHLSPPLPSWSGPVTALGSYYRRSASSCRPFLRDYSRFLRGHWLAPTTLARPLGSNQRSVATLRQLDPRHLQLVTERREALARCCLAPP